MRKHLYEQLQRRDMGGIAEAARRKRRILGALISLLYDPDPLIGWRAVEAMGEAANCIAEDDPDFVREHLRRLYWLISEESGGICWRAPEAMAEIVRHRPRQFADYIPIVAGLILSLAEEDLDHFKAGILWAIGRLGAEVGDHARDVLPAVSSSLNDPDSQVRGLAVWCLGRLGQPEFLHGRTDLLGDEGAVDLYEDGALHRVTVGDLVRRTVADRTSKE